MSTLAPDLPIPAWLEVVEEDEGRERLLNLARSGTIALAARELLQVARDAGHREYTHGSYRRAFRASGTVVKIVNSFDDSGYKSQDHREEEARHGAWSSLHEARMHDEGTYCGPVAPTRLVWHESGLPIIVMEWLDLTPRSRVYPRPAWSGQVEKAQIGWSRRSREWMVYDAGCAVDSYQVPLPPWWPEGATD